MKYTIFLICFGFLLESCNEANREPLQKNNTIAYKADNAPTPSDARYKNGTTATGDMSKTYLLNAQANAIAPDEALIVDRKLIWNAHLEFRVKSLNKSSTAVRDLCKKHQGYISTMEREEKSWELSTHITIRVENSHFHDLVADIKGESNRLDIASITSDDVTEEYVDIENRLATKRKARERYIEILRSKTGTIDDVIQAEEAIRRITEEIEAKEGRLRFLSDQMEFSTITLRMYQPIQAPKPQLAKAETYGDKAKASFSSGWQFIKGVGLALISIWPLLLLVTGLMIWKHQWFGRIFRRSAK